MDAVNLYVVLRAPSRAQRHVVYQTAVDMAEFERLRAAYRPSALESAVTAALDLLERALDSPEEAEPRHDGEDSNAPDHAEMIAVEQLLGCLAAEAHESIRAGNRWAVIDVRYDGEDARIAVACSSSEPSFATVADSGHA